MPARPTAHLFRAGLLAPLIALFVSCGGPTVADELQGRWIQNLDPLVDQVFVFKSDSVEFDFIDHGSITSTWTEKYTNVFKTNQGVNVIQTSGPPAFAWYVSGDTLYLDWVNSDEEPQLESLPADWWQSEVAQIWTRY